MTERLTVRIIRINLVIPGEMESFDKFQTELGGVLEAVKASVNYESMHGLLTADPRYAAMSNESVEAINTFTGTRITLNEKEGETNMGIAWDEMLNEERAEAQRELIKRMLAKHKTPQEIADLCDYDIKEVEAVEKEMCMLA